MTGVVISHNLPEFRKWIRLAASRQIPFATAVALTKTAKLARDVVVFGLPARFVVRGKKLAQSIRYKPANKRDWPRPQSSVYTLAQALVLQELGGVKKPRRKDIAIPGKGTRPTPQTRITPGKRPAAVLKKRGGFLQTLKGGANAGADAILQRTSAARYPIRVAYLLRPSGQVAPVLKFADSVRLTVSTTLDREWLIAMEQAFATKKP